MYIKSIVIEGFKSYAHRTEIGEFNHLFNAITGLNGSGKSNILDSICFLLGISNMTQVRASNLQELVYKCGQAGVTKALVSITFDNRDKPNSPLGYEQYDEFTVCRQVVIGGRNKYTINGSNALNTRVQDLFRSVQLNVNNPHFLIMQGRITKVLNMKPQEILSMIEEAAGTKLYESKKESALKTIEKKNTKLAEIDNILKEEITPKLNKLKDERSSYLNYQKIIRELDQLNKLYIAYRFVCAEEAWKKSGDEVNDMIGVTQTLNDTIKEINDKIKDLDALIAELEKKRDLESGSAMGVLEEELKKCQAEEAKCQSVVDSKKKLISAEQRALKDVKKNITDDNKALETKEREIERQSSEWERIQSEHQKDQEAITTAQQRYQAVCAGLFSNEDGENATLNDQLLVAKSEICKADTEIKQAEMRLKHDSEEIKKRQQAVRQTEQQYKKDKAIVDSLDANIAKIQGQINKLNYEDGQEETLQNQRRQLDKDIDTLQERISQFNSKYPHFVFEYSDPEPGFNRGKVHGLVSRLIQLKHPEMALALEITAGEKLHNVVVDTEQTGKKLLEKGKLARRCTIIPLNKISARPIDAATLKKAQTLVGKDNVYTALSLVSYNTVLQPAMEFVFGSTFVCKTMDDAKKVAFNEGIMRRCVTLDGDVFDPSGTVSGGSRPKCSAILQRVSEIGGIETSLAEKRTQLQQLDKQLSSLSTAAKKYRELTENRDRCSEEVALKRDALNQGSHQQELDEIHQLEATIGEQNEIIKTAKQTRQHCTKRVKDLESKINNAASIREKEMKDAEEKVKQCKKQMDQSNKAMQETQQVWDSLKLECEELKKGITSYNEQIETITQTEGQLSGELKDLLETVKEKQSKVKDAKHAHNAQKELLKSCNKDIAGLDEERRQLTNRVKNSELKIKEMEHQINKQKKDSKDAAKQVEEMIKSYEWIADEKKFFGKPNTGFDFSENNPKEAGKRISELEETKRNLEKSVNMRAINMLGSAEEQYNDLLNKQRIVLNDKAKIRAVIEELDEKKNEVLQQALVKVNKDFGSIFSTLLPGTQAKLVHPDGTGVVTGLEIKVAFGDVWKQSLSELSGGQRSLVALSLILAMLLFKPAPIYILDEVDAALDLSHTQNIGEMIKKHFKQSQFIVVSLKDGMFNNANVLFKTKLVDGVSTVSRHVLLPRSHSSNQENEPLDDKKENKQSVKK